MDCALTILVGILVGAAAMWAVLRWACHSEI